MISSRIHRMLFIRNKCRNRLGSYSGISQERITEYVKEGGCVARREEYEARTEALVLPIVEKYGFELVDVEYVKEGSSWYLRCYIDKEGGIFVNDCELVHRELGDLLDAEDFVEGSYILEVSSPGLGRPLKKEKDFARSIGKDVEVRTFRKIDKCKEFTGCLKAYDKDTVTIEQENGEEHVFDRTDIALIHLAFDF